MSSTRTRPPSDGNGSHLTEASPVGPRLAVDGPFGDAVLYLHNALRLSGWATASGGPVEVVVDVEGDHFAAESGLPSPDVVSAHGDRPGADRARFDLIVDAREFPSARRQVQVLARGATGEEAVLIGEIEFAPYALPAFTDDENRARIEAGEPAMWVTDPWLDGTARLVAPVTVRGWACSGAGIAGVHVYVDGVIKVAAVHGFPVPAMRALLGERAAAAGFTVTLDPRECGLGDHELVVVATDHAGRAVGWAGPIACLEQRSPPPREVESETEQLTDERYVPEAHVGTSLEVEHQARYRWIAPLAAGARVLDAACGTGFGSAVLLASEPASIDAFDLSPLAVEDARRRLGERVTVVEGDLTAIPFGDDVFDLVVCFEAIEHVRDAERGLHELARVLAPGGTLAISTPNRGVYTDSNPYHRHEFSSSEFEAALKAHFREVRVWRQDTHAATLIVDDAGLELEDPGSHLEAEVRKTRGGQVGSELYMVALAGDGPLPAPRPQAVLGNALDASHALDEARAWREQAALVAKNAASVRAQGNSALRAAERELELTISRHERAVALYEHTTAMHEEAMSLNERVAAERDDALTRLDAIARSRSWRWTAHLRALRGAVSRLRRRS
jgi:SAM-dependent methyltransferase